MNSVQENTNSINLNQHQIRMLMDVALHNSITKAAQINYVSQPYLSQFIKGLEKKLGFSLYKRSKGNLVLTPEGKSFYEALVPFSEASDSFLEQVGSIISKLDESSTLRIGMPLEMSEQYYDRIFKLFKDKEPSVQMVLTEAASRTLISLCMEGNLDLALIGDMDIPDRIKSITLENEPMYLIVPTDNVFFHEEAVNNTEDPPLISADDIKKLNECTMILCTEHQGLGHTARRMLKRFDILPKNIIETRSSNTSLRLTVSGLGFSMAIASYVKRVYDKEHNKMQIYYIGDPPERWSRNLIVRDGVELSKPLRECIEICKDVFS